MDNELIREVRQPVFAINGNIRKLSEELFHQHRLLTQAMEILPSSLESSDDDDEETLAPPLSRDPLDNELS